MKDIRYMIHTLSAKAIMSFSKENEDGSYSFLLSQNETDKCKLNRKGSYRAPMAGAKRRQRSPLLGGGSLGECPNLKKIEKGA